MKKILVAFWCMSVLLQVANAQTFESLPVNPLGGVVQSTFPDLTTSLKQQVRGYTDTFGVYHPPQAAYLPSGVYSISETIETANGTGGLISGQGYFGSPYTQFASRSSGTCLVWNGPAEEPMFRLSGRNCTIQYATLYGAHVHQPRPEDRRGKTAIQTKHVGGLGSGKHKLELQFIGWQRAIVCGDEKLAGAGAHHDKIFGANCYFEYCDTCHLNVNSQSQGHYYSPITVLQCKHVFEVRAGGGIGCDHAMCTEGVRFFWFNPANTRKEYWPGPNSAVFTVNQLDVDQAEKAGGNRFQFAVSDFLDKGLPATLNLSGLVLNARGSQTLPIVDVTGPFQINVDKSRWLGEGYFVLRADQDGKAPKLNLGSNDGYTNRFYQATPDSVATAQPRAMAAPAEEFDSDFDVYKKIED